MKFFYRTKPLLPFLLILVFWGYFLFNVPTFDFDESLYRRVSEAMKASGDPWLLSWDERPLYHKPPVFYWLICVASWILHEGSTTVSSMAARLPSLLASLGIAGSIHYTLKTITQKNGKPELAVPGTLTLVCATFPLMTSAAVIFDPLQTLALMPALLIPTLFFESEEEPTIRQLLGISIGLALAAMVKGLNGLVIPAAAILIHSLMSEQFRKRPFRWMLRFFGAALLPAFLCIGAFYWVLNQKIGPDFTHEFLWIQHFQRSRSPMEAHGGGPLYHLGVVFFGGTFLSTILVRLLTERRALYRRFGFPFTFAAAFVVFFSVSATKLPHYTWPAWPAIALGTGLWLLAPKVNSKRAAPFALGLGALPTALAGALAMILAVAWEPLTQALSSPSLPLLQIPPPGPIEKASLLIASLAFLIHTLIHLRSEIPASDRIRSAAVLSALSALFLLTGLGPTLNHALVRPFHEVARTLRELKATRADCIRYTGAFSATLSLELAPDLLHNRCEPGDAKFLISPEWKANECEERGLRRIIQHQYLVLCGR